MKRIAVLSDTHGLLREEVIQSIEGCDAIVHAGDINNQQILDRLSALAPLYVVRGNNDNDWAAYIPQNVMIHMEDCTLFVVHNKKDIPEDLSGVDVVIFGHSHRYSEQIVGGRLLLNPGSCGKRRFNQEITFAILTICEKEIHVEKKVVDCPPLNV